MKVRLLDGGSIVIEHTQLLWNVPGPQSSKLKVLETLESALNSKLRFCS